MKSKAHLTITTESIPSVDTMEEELFVKVKIDMFRIKRDRPRPTDS